MTAGARRHSWRLTHASCAKEHCLEKRFLNQCGSTEIKLGDLLIVTNAGARRHSWRLTHASCAKRHCPGKRFLSQCGTTESRTRMLIVTTAASRSAHGRTVRLARPVDRKIASKNPSVSRQSKVSIRSGFPRPLQNVMNGYARNAARLLVEIARRTCLPAQSRDGRRQAPRIHGLAAIVSL